MSHLLLVLLTLQFQQRPNLPYRLTAECDSEEYATTLSVSLHLRQEASLAPLVLSPLYVRWAIGRYERTKSEEKAIVFSLKLTALKELPQTHSKITLKIYLQF